MFRFHDQKARSKPYDKQSLLRAFEATRTGVSVYRAARMYSVPESTLRDRTRGIVSLDGTRGPDTLLSHSEEQQLVDHISYMASIGYGYTKSNIQFMAAEFARSLDAVLEQWREKITLSKLEDKVQAILKFAPYRTGGDKLSRESRKRAVKQNETKSHLNGDVETHLQESDSDQAHLQESDQ